MDYAHVELIRASIAALRALPAFANPADERERRAFLETLTRSLDGIQFEFTRDRTIKQKEMF